MNKIAVDLHMHSCLSPCGDDAMTPNNIVNMAYLKGLDAIAVADHNTAANLPAAEAVAKARGVILLPALEVQSREEVHMLCYFPDVGRALQFSDEIYESLPPMPNHKALFGAQTVLDEDDEFVREEDRLLLQSLSLSLEALFEKTAALGGVCVPAHINRQSHSLLYVLGFIPPDIPFTAMEVSPFAPAPSIPLDKYHVTRSSDAHQLEDILERESFLRVKERSVEGILDALTRKK